MGRALISLNLPSRPDPVCKGLWEVYMDSVVRARLKKPCGRFDKWTERECDRALRRYFDAVEHELAWLNAE
jgi:hypothetical protein